MTTMLLERRSRPIRGVRIVRQESAPFGLQVIPTRRLSTADVRRILDRLPPTDGPIVTSALNTIEQEAFTEAGFVERESLYLLRHDFSAAPRATSDARIRSARRTDLANVITIDGQSFDPFWTFDRVALSTARKATPTHRYAVACIDRRVVGYVIVGLAGAASFLQRLAVHPDVRGQGVGSHLVCDSIEWARQRSSTHMMVNTQMSNAGAFALYQRLGFSVDTNRLKVLEWHR